MTRDTTSPSESSQPPVPPGSAPDDFIDGLALDRLHRSGVITFLQGLPRRAAGLFPEPPSGEGADGDDPTANDDAWLDLVGSTLTEMTDRLEALIDRLQAAGYPLNPNTGEVEAGEPPAGLPPSLGPDWRRFSSAAIEALRWSDGVPSDGWMDENLVAHGRAAVGELGWLLRLLEDQTDETP